MLKVVEKRDEKEAGQELLLLDEIAREGARRMLIEALKAEADDYIERHRSERDKQGYALVVRNGCGRARKLMVGAGAVEVRVPRVEDRRRDDNGRRQRFTSHILLPYMRRSPKLAEVLPILYLRGHVDRRFPPRPRSAVR
jgi:putative transposase